MKFTFAFHRAELVGKNIYSGPHSVIHFFHRRIFQWCLPPGVSHFYPSSIYWAVRPFGGNHWAILGVDYWLCRLGSQYTKRFRGPRYVLIAVRVEFIILMPYCENMADHHGHGGHGHGQPIQMNDLNPNTCDHVVCSPSSFPHTTIWKLTLGFFQHATHNHTIDPPISSHQHNLGLLGVLVHLCGDAVNSKFFSNTNITAESDSSWIVMIRQI